MRTGGQVLGLASYRNPNVLSAMADVLYKYKQDLALSTKVDSVARLHTVQRHPEMAQYTGIK